MRSIRYLALGAVVAGLAAFRLQAGPDDAGTPVADLPGITAEAAAAVAPGEADPADAVRARSNDGARRAAPEQEPSATGADGASEGEEVDEAPRQREDGGDREESEDRRDDDGDDRGRPSWDDDDRNDRNDRRRDWRRRSRSRYPGPIPSPDEWEPPEGPVKIALQAGHWKADEAPRELNGLRGGGTRWGTMHEWEANLEIARRTGAMLEELGYEVDILPAVVPPSYRAHLFISIHADGSNDPAARGYRIAAPRRDATGRAEQLVSLLERSYGEATGLGLIPTVTRRMRSYYAFNFRRYEHALHPMTIGVIIETGFLTSASDRGVIVDDPDRAARGIVEAVKAFPVTAQPKIAQAEVAGRR